LVIKRGWIWKLKSLLSWALNDTGSNETSWRPW
jgi:hypothetical protein